jgi:hypothetical protein
VMRVLLVVLLVRHAETVDARRKAL